MRPRPLPAVLALAAALTVVACSGDRQPAAGARCEVGDWTSTGVQAPSQAGVGDIAPTGGGEGMRIRIAPEGGFQIDFGPMQPSTGTFDSGGTTGGISTVFSGVGEGVWQQDQQGVLVAAFADFSTVTATVTLTLGDTVPPVFDESLEKINNDRMLDGRQAGVFTATSCADGALELTMPFPGGDVVILATRT